jgi:hypothetical protein
MHTKRQRKPSSFVCFWHGLLGLIYVTLGYKPSFFFVQPNLRTALLGRKEEFGNCKCKAILHLWVHLIKSTLSLFTNDYWSGCCGWRMHVLAWWPPPPPPPPFLTLSKQVQMLGYYQWQNRCVIEQSAPNLCYNFQRKWNKTKNLSSILNTFRFISKWLFHDNSPRINGRQKKDLFKGH